MIQCSICGASIHSVELHLKQAHPGLTKEQYQAQFPNAPMFSPEAEKVLREKGALKDNMATKTLASVATAPAQTAVHKLSKKALHEIFGLPAKGEALNSRGGPIPITVFEASPGTQEYTREIDPDHVWNVDDLKNILMAIEMNIPLLMFGHKGTGKTTDLVQVAARTGRPMIRVQHTGNTEEAHITGQYVVRNGNLEFQLGLLAIAMRDGIMYVADEYDFARPEVLAVYQPVMEGEPLVIKEAPPELRVIRPAPGFVFCATGNTNGTGDSTGLYQGTTVQNAANYDRFGIVIKKEYMPEADEVAAVMKHTGVVKPEVEKLVKFAKEIRTMFDAGKLSDTISTRTLINIANVGLRRTKMTYGVTLCYSNKLNPTDQAAINGVAQRFFG